MYMGPPPHPLILLFLRDLLQLGGELVRTSRAVQEVGLGLSASLQRAESRAEAALEKQKLLQAQLEEQLQAKLLREKDLAQLQVQSDLDKADLSARWVVAGPSTADSPAGPFPGEAPCLTSDDMCDPNSCLLGEPHCSHERQPQLLSHVSAKTQRSPGEQRLTPGPRRGEGDPRVLVEFQETQTGW